MVRAAQGQADLVQPQLVVRLAMADTSAVAAYLGLCTSGGATTHSFCRREVTQLPSPAFCLLMASP